MTKKYTFIIFFISQFFIFKGLLSQQTVGLFEYQSEAGNGYVLFSPFASKSTYMIDNCGRLVKEWVSDEATATKTILLPNGNLLKNSTPGIASNPVFAFGGAANSIREVDWEENVLWEYTLSDSTARMHHDFVLMPNGNLLLLAWEVISGEEAISLGRDTTLLPDGVLWGEFILEIDRETKQTVWEWHAKDHLIQDFDDSKSNFGIISEHPELLNFNVTGGPTADGGKNWMHINSIDYNPMMNQILINSFFLSELYIIDHSTTTQEAASHSGGASGKGGDILYRWGNPSNYDHGDNRTIFGGHHAHWIPPGLPDEGKIMFFNNGNGRPDGSYSSVDIINPPVDDYATGQYIYTEGVAYFPQSAEWTFSASPVESFYSRFLSGAQRLPNGNTFICSGANGRFFEITPDKNIVWDYINPVTKMGILSQGDSIPVNNGRKANIVFRAYKYEADFSGLLGKDLTAGDPIELNFPEPYDCEILSGIKEKNMPVIKVMPNPVSDILLIEFDRDFDGQIEIFDTNGSKIHTVTDRQVNVSDWEEGIYQLSLSGRIIGRFVVVK